MSSQKQNKQTGASLVHRDHPKKREQHNRCLIGGKYGLSTTNLDIYMTC